MGNYEDIRWAALVLAAGKGTRMKSDLPKVLHKAAGKPMLARVLEAVQACNIRKTVVVIGGELDQFSEVLKTYPSLVVTQQNERKGTADAVASGCYGLSGVQMPSYADGQLLRGEKIACDYVLICTGDTPALSGQTLGNFIEQGLGSGREIGVVGMIQPEPTGYGRLVLDSQNNLKKIVEEKDADNREKSIRLCNSGIIYCKLDLLGTLLTKIDNRNRSGEFYLTDCFEAAAKLGKEVFVFQTENYREFDGVNTPDQLNRISQWLTEQGRI